MATKRNGRSYHSTGARDRIINKLKPRHKYYRCREHLVFLALSVIKNSNYNGSKQVEIICGAQLNGAIAKEIRDSLLANELVEYTGYEDKVRLTIKGLRAQQILEQMFSMFEHGQHDGIYVRNYSKLLFT